MDYSVKNVRALSGGLEGNGFSATIYADDKKIGTVRDDGNGGEAYVDVPDAENKKAFDAFLATFPPEDFGGHKLEMTADLYLARLVDEALDAARIKRRCAKKTLFRVKGDPEGECRTVNSAYSEAVKAFITKKYGDSVEEILNERFIEGAKR